MKRTLYFSLAIIFLLSSVGTKAQTLDDILSKYYSAIGGIETIKAANSCVVSGRIISGGGNWKRPYTITLKQGKLRAEMDIQPGLKMVQGYDGSTGWNIMPWTGSLEPQPMNADDSKNLAIMAEMLKNDLVTYKEKGTVLSYNGTEEIDGSDCFKIVAKRSDGVTREYYLDVDSYLIVKIITKYRARDEEQESDTYFSNYKKVNGVMLPCASESKNGGGFYIDTFNFNATIDDQIFSMPKKNKNDDSKAN